MKYYTIQPPKQLAPYIRYFWVLECDVSIDAPYVHRTLADGCAELIFHYTGHFKELTASGQIESTFTAGVHGPSDHIRRFSINHNFGIFGVYLYPFTLTHLFSIPATEFINQMPDLKTLLGNSAHALEEKMMLAKDDRARVKIISEFLEAKLANAKNTTAGIMETIRCMIHADGINNVKQFAKQNFLSVRQFERNFKKASGFSPKLFSRITRFQSALKEYGIENKLLTEIALECHYYDQSHFIHDFKKFSGHHPKNYFSGKAEAAAFRVV